MSTSSIALSGVENAKGTAKGTAIQAKGKIVPLVSEATF